MIYLMLLSSLISFIELYAMLPYTEQTINITCSDNENTVMPVSIAAMSETLSSMISDLGGTIIINKNGTISIELENIDNINFPITSYSCSTINDLCTVLEKFNTTKILNIQNIKDNTLKELTTISNAFDFFGFSIDLKTQWNKKIGGTIYLRCKDMSLPDLEQQVIAFPPLGLNPEPAKMIFGDPAIDKFRLELMKRALTLADRIIELPTEGFGGAVFSPNSKMLAAMVAKDAMTTVSLFNDEDVISQSTQNLLNKNSFWIDSANFSNDGKKFIIGNGNEILIYDIDDTGKIDKDPVQTLEVTAPPQGQENIGWQKKQISLDRSGKRMASYYGHALFLWHFNENGTIDPTPKSLLITNDDTTIISPIKFSDDGSIFIVCQNKKDNNSILRIFNIDGSSSESIINETLSEATFYEHDKKFAAIIAGPGYGLYVYDFSDKDNISHNIISFSCFAPVSILNDTAIIAKGASMLVLIDINNNNESTQIKIDSRISDFFISPDSKKIVFQQYRDPYLLCTLLTPQEEKTLNSIKKLEVKQIVLIDKVLRKTEDVSSLERHKIPSEIIELLKEIGLESQKEILPKEKESKKIETPMPTPPPTQEPMIAAPKVAAAIQYHKQQEQKTNIPIAEIKPTPTATTQQTEAPIQPEQPEGNKQEPGIIASIFSGISSIASSIISTIGSVLSAILRLFTR